MRANTRSTSRQGKRPSGRLLCMICGLAEGNSLGIEVRRFSLIASHTNGDGTHTTRGFGTIGLCARCHREQNIAVHRRAAS